MKIMQGDSRRIPIEITQDNMTITPYMLADVEVCVGENVRKAYSNGDVTFDESTGFWYIRLTQEETFGMDGTQEVIVRVKYKNKPYADVIGYKAGIINAADTISREVL